MKKLVLLMVLSLLLTGLAACQSAEPTPTETDPPVVETPTEAETEVPTEPETEPVTEPETEPVTEPSGPQVMDLVGTWKRTHTEVEGYREENTKATITISGTSEEDLIITFKDKEFERFNFKEKALTYCEGELYTDCGNAVWYMEVVSDGEGSYFVTLLEDGSVLLRNLFLVDGAPMVSHQWFARN